MSQQRLRDLLAETLKDCREVAMGVPGGIPLLRKIDASLAAIADDTRWNGPTGTNLED